MALMAGLITLSCVLNAVFLEKYYIKQQQKAILLAFNRVKAVIGDDGIDQEELGNVMYDISTEQNMVILVVDSNFDKVYSLKSDSEKTKRWLQDYYFSPYPKESETLSSGDTYVIRTSYNIYDE